jgi:hypothetical protein
MVTAAAAAGAAAASAGGSFIAVDAYACECGGQSGGVHLLLRLCVCLKMTRT